MKLIIVVLLGIACCAQGYLTKWDYSAIKADKDYLVKQKFVLDVLRHVYQPFMIEEYFHFGKFYVEDPTFYTNYDKVIEFFDYYKSGFLPHDGVFSIVNKRHLVEVRSLFYLFYYSKDFITFQKNVVWARMYVNPELFVHAFYASIIYRDDFVGVMLPPPYEVMPYKFFDAQVIDEVYKVVLQKPFVTDFTYTIYRNWTDYYDYPMNTESKLNYFTNDVGLNTYYYFFHFDYGYWLGGADFKFEGINRGEVYLFVHQQLLARYYMERLSNNLGEIYEFEWDEPIVTGYFPNLRYFNGVMFPMRHNNYLVKTFTHRDELIELVVDYERRIREVIDSGFLFIEDGTFVNIKDPKGIDYLGNIIQSNYDSKNIKFYQYVEIFAKVLLGGSFAPVDDYKIVPSVLEHFETALRDPVFYQLYKRIIKFYWRFKDNLKSYTKKDLDFKDIVINDVVVTKLLTFVDYYEFDVTNVLDFVYKPDYVYKDYKFTDYKVKDYKYTKPVVHITDYEKPIKPGFEVFDYLWKYYIKFRNARLNHEPFSVTLDVTSDKVQKVVVRTFYGPKYDEFGKLYKLQHNYINFVEIDKFYYDLKVGKNFIKRFSKDFYYTIQDVTTYRELYKYVMTGDFTKFPYVTDFYAGFPDNLLLPKGTIGGFPVQFYFIITPYTGIDIVDKVDKSTYHDYKLMFNFKTWRFLDNYALGFPFDRTILYDYSYWTTTNMFWKDVLIYHRDYDYKVNYVV